MDGIERRLAAGLARPLPGSRAQRLMAPVPRPGWTHPFERPERVAAVLILTYPFERRHESGPSPALALTERTDSVEWHKRQVSFPGGVLRSGEAAEAGAIREAGEEIGVAPEAVRALGRLSPLFVPATGFMIQPIVAITGARPDFTANPREVARILEVPIAHLVDPATAKVDAIGDPKRWSRRPYFDLDGTALWGASAMIAAEFLTLLGWPGPDFKDGSPPLSAPAAGG
jgi:8-oxo-dGTP pyrophosphatase MutT (NUDIX family)